MVWKFNIVIFIMMNNGFEIIFAILFYFSSVNQTFQLFLFYFLIRLFSITVFFICFRSYKFHFYSSRD